MIISDLNILETVTAGNVLGGCCLCGYKYNDKYEDKKYKNEDKKYKNNDKKYENDEDKKYLNVIQETDVKVTVTPKVSIY